MRPAASKFAPLQTDAELLLVKHILIGGVMLDVLEYEVSKLKMVTELKMASIYIRKLHDIQQSLPHELHQLQRELKSSGIRIIATTRFKGRIEAKYLCRGYEHEIILLGDIIRAEIEVKLAAQFGIELNANYQDDDDG